MQNTEVAPPEVCSYPFSPDQQRVYDRILDSVYNDGDTDFFLTGAAGTGKGYVVKALVETLSRSKVVHVTATTGMAATLVNGGTVHRWAGYTPTRGFNSNDIVRERISQTEVLIIDEVSMLSCKIFTDLYLHMLDNGFNGTVIAVGDFFQLAPVPSGADTGAYCFESEAWTEFELLSLEHQHRAEGDSQFVDLLSRLRTASTTSADNALLQSRTVIDGLDVPHLFGTRKEAEGYNNQRLAQIDSPEVKFAAQSHVMFQREAERYAKRLRFPLELRLKVGALVMFLVNDQEDRFVNGTTGIVREITDHCVQVECAGGRLIHLGRETEEVYDYKPDRTEQMIVYAHKQFPLQLAWGMTTHKAQGATMEAAVVDCSRFWAEGQHYVAISRLQSLAGLYVRNFDPRKVKASRDVKRYMGM